MARNFAPLLYGFYRSVQIPVRGLEFLGRRVFLRSLKPSTGGKEEVEILVLRGHSEGLISDRDTSTLISALHLTERKAGELMTPVKDVQFLSLDLDMEGILREVRATNHYRIPVFRGSLDNVLGMVHVKDLIFSLRTEVPVDRLVRPVAYLFKDWAVDVVLKEMKKKGTSLGIVTDEHGVTMGILTLEDIAGAVVG
jgi:CBS domain containing-hemolysin-like protein